MGYFLFIKKFACGSRDMKVFRMLQERTQTRINNLDNVNLKKGITLESTSQKIIFFMKWIRKKQLIQH